MVSSWHLRSVGLVHATTYFDGVNAFGSTDRERLHAAGAL